MDETVIEQTKSEIESMLGEIRDSVISLENYQKYFDKIEGNKRIINTYIENVTRERREINLRVKDLKSKPSYEDYRSQGLVSLEIYDLQMRSARFMSNAYSWMTTLAEMYSLLFSKFGEVFDTARAYEMKKGALDLMQEELQTRNRTTLEQTKHLTGMTTDIVNNKVLLLEEKYNNLVNSVLLSFTKVITSFHGVSDDKKSLIVDGLERDVKSFVPKSVVKSKVVGSGDDSGDVVVRGRGRPRKLDDFEVDDVDKVVVGKVKDKVTDSFDEEFLE